MHYICLNVNIYFVHFKYIFFILMFYIFVSLSSPPSSSDLWTLRCLSTLTIQTPGILTVDKGELCLIDRHL